MIAKNARQRLLLADAELTLRPGAPNSVKTLLNNWLEAEINVDEEKQLALKYRGHLSDEWIIKRIQNLSWMQKKDNSSLLKTFLSLNGRRVIANESTHKTVKGKKILLGHQYDAYKTINSLFRLV